MSHFLVYVIVPKSVPFSAIEEHVQAVLAPFDEDLDVPPWLDDCPCLGAVATEHGRCFANEHYAHFSALRSTYANDPAVVEAVERQRALAAARWPLTPEDRAEYENLEALTNDRWKTIVGPWMQKAEQATKLHPLYEKPDPDCDTCKGTGKYETTENPHGKWDWYRIGGRFDGVVVGEPNDDGYGNLSLDRRHESLEKNTLDMDRLPDPIPDSIVPFAIVDPDGTWHEKGKMGWFAAVRDEDKGWPERAKSLLEKHRGGGHRIVAVDCHV